MLRRYAMQVRARLVDETRARIINALTRLLGRTSYGAITMSNIAQDADVSVRTVQRHYRSKDEILAACFQMLSEELSRWPAAESAEGTIRDLVEALFAFYHRHREECWAIYSRAADVPELSEAFRRVVEAHMSQVEGLIARWPDVWAVDRESAKRTMAALTSYPAWRGFTDFERFTTLEAATLVIDLLCRSLLRRREPSLNGSC